MLSLINDDIQYCFWDAKGNSTEPHNLSRFNKDGVYLGLFCMTCMKWRKEETKPDAPKVTEIIRPKEISTVAEKMAKTLEKIEAKKKRTEERYNRRKAKMEVAPLNMVNLLKAYNKMDNHRFHNGAYMRKLYGDEYINKVLKDMMLKKDGDASDD